MKREWLLVLALIFCWLLFPLAQPLAYAATQVDAKAEVAAALFAASATQAAAERLADAKIRKQRQEIEELRAQVQAGKTKLKAELTLAEEKFVAALADRDRAYAQEIAVFRAAVEDISATPEGATALARFNAGDEIGALAILDDLITASDAALQKRTEIERAAKRRPVATLALEARKRGKLTTAQVIARFEEVTRLDPDMHWDWVELGRLYTEAGKLSAALASSQTALDIAKKLVKDYPTNLGGMRDLAVSHEQLGDVCVAHGNLADALTNFQASLAIREFLSEVMTKVNPTYTGCQRDLAVSYVKIGEIQGGGGDLPAALESFQASLDITKKLAKNDPANTGCQRDLAVSYEKIGDVQFAQGDLPAALENFQVTLDIALKLTKNDPANTLWQHDLSVSLVKIGNVQIAQGDIPAALASFQDSLDIREKLVKADPSNLDWQGDIAAAYDKIGNVQVAQGDIPAALASFQDSLDIREKLAKADPSNPGWQRNVAVSYVKIGDKLFAIGDFPAALASFQASLDILEELTEADPANTLWQHDLSISYEKIGNVQVAQGDFSAALASFQASHSIAEKLAKGDPTNSEWQRDLIVSYVKMSRVTGDAEYVSKALDIALTMQKNGTLPPRDAWMIDKLKQMSGQ